MSRLLKLNLRFRIIAADVKHSTLFVLEKLRTFYVAKRQSPHFWCRLLARGKGTL